MPVTKERRDTPKDKETASRRPPPEAIREPADKEKQPAPAAAGLSEADYGEAIAQAVKDVHG